MSLNLVTLMGHLVRDPEVKYLGTGTAVGNFSLALNDVWKDKQGEKQEYVNYIDCEAWGNTAESIAEYLKKGDPLIVLGSLRQNRWEDAETQQKRSKVIVRVQSFTFVPRGRPRDGGDVRVEPPLPDEAPPF